MQASSIITFQTLIDNPDILERMAQLQAGFGGGRLEKEKDP